MFGGRRCSLGAVLPLSRGEWYVVDVMSVERREGPLRVLAEPEELRVAELDGGFTARRVGGRMIGAAAADFSCRASCSSCRRVSVNSSCDESWLLEADRGSSARGPSTALRSDCREDERMGGCSRRAGPAPPRCCE